MLTWLSIPFYGFMPPLRRGVSHRLPAWLSIPFYGFPIWPWPGPPCHRLSGLSIPFYGFSTVLNMSQNILRARPFNSILWIQLRLGGLAGGYRIAFNSILWIHCLSCIRGLGDYVDYFQFHFMDSASWVSWCVFKPPLYTPTPLHLRGFPLWWMAPGPLCAIALGA